jgi:hypothetical protein
MNRSQLHAALQAKKTYEQMEDDGVRPNTRFFTAYIRLCGRSVLMPSAMLSALSR